MEPYQARSSATAARRACERLGVDPRRIELVVWLVRHHLLMSDYAQKRDVSDPSTVRAFAEAVGVRVAYVKPHGALYNAVVHHERQAAALVEAVRLLGDDLVALGLRNREIAARLFIAENTAKNHVQRVLTKLGMSSRAEAAAFAVRAGLLSPS